MLQPMVSSRRDLSVVLGIVLSSSSLVLWTARGLAQSPTALPAFDVAEIKLNRLGSPMSGDLHQAGHLHLTGISLRLLMAAAWQVKDYAIVGAPAWIDSDHFDVAANAPPGTSTKDIQLMLRSLLLERFRLVVHDSEKVTRVYALVVVRGGPKFHATTAASSDLMGCSGGRANGLAHRTCKNTSMALFAEQLPRMSPHYIDVPVVNLTELEGHYDFDLSWQPQQLQAKTDLAGPSIFDAVRDQLGLKLESSRLPVRTIVIDKIERLDGER